MFFNWKTVSGLIYGGLLIITFNTSNLASALKAEEVPTPQSNQGNTTSSSHQRLNTEGSHEQNTNLQLPLLVIGLGSAVVASAIVCYWYKSAKKIQCNYNEQSKDLKSSENSSKKNHHNNKLRFISTQRVTESATDPLEVEEAVNGSSNYYSPQDRNDSSSSNCGSDGYDNSSDRGSSHDNSSSSSDCGSSYDSGGSSDSGSSDSSW